MAELPDRNEMEALLRRLEALIQKSYDQIEFRKKTQPGAPANEAQIAAVEEAFGHKLEATYRMFLSIHNGWQLWSGDVALLSTDQMLTGEYPQRIAEWREDEPNVGECIVIGFSLYAGEQILMSTEPQSEGHTVVWHYQQVENHETFYEYLLQHERDVQELVEGGQ